ncbi:MAG: NAD(P)H-hydrate epimerase [Clostridia bacterium]|nr:NAD(P)H-hydrate epimerase [Clostridia bacterium]
MNRNKPLETPVLSVAQMRQADADTIAHGTPSVELMRRAAQGIFDAYDGWEGHRTLVICGSGNNGGDGYALAQILAGHGYSVEILRVSEKFSEDGRFYYEKCRTLGIPAYSYDASVDFGGFDILVDCMLGTGFAGVPREPIAEVIRRVNEAKEKGAFVISADINSGMNGDTGEAELAVKSDLTVSIGYLKHGLLQGRAKERIGRLVNVEIGIELKEETE